MGGGRSLSCLLALQMGFVYGGLVFVYISDQLLFTFGLRFYFTSSRDSVVCRVSGGFPIGRRSAGTTFCASNKH